MCEARWADYRFCTILNADCLKNYDWRETTKQVDYGYTTLD